MAQTAARALEQTFDGAVDMRFVAEASASAHANGRDDMAKIVGGVSMQDSQRYAKGLLGTLASNSLDQYEDNYNIFVRYIKLFGLVPSDWDGGLTVKLLCSYWERLIEEHKLAMARTVAEKHGKDAAYRGRILVRAWCHYLSVLVHVLV